MHTTAKRIVAACGMAVMLVLVASITAMPAFAASNGIYIASAHPHYRNPQTGIIEDSGGDNSEVLGQSMTESVTYRRALVEVDQNGNTYATIRLQMMDNITNAQFQVDGSPVSATCMQENYGANTADYRIPVNSESSLIRCNISVSAMGRDVVFFVTLSNLEPGSEDFITSVTVTEPEPEAPTQPEPTPETPAPPAPSEPTAPTDTPAKEETPAQNKTPEESKKPAKPDEKKPGIQEFDAKGNAVDKADKPASQGHSMRTFAIVAGVVVAVAAVGGCIWYFGFFKKKK